MSLYSSPTTERGVWSRLWHRRAPEPVDPFRALALQMRLSVVADLLRTIERDERMFARGQRWIATRDAYDALLGDACRAAGVPADRRPPDEGERTRMELELASRGWSW